MEDCPKRNSLAGLPEEAMLEILARVPFRSVCRSKCVAKAWRDLIDDPLNRRRLPQTLQGFFHLFHSMDHSCADDLEDFFFKYSASPVPLDIDLSFSFLRKLPETDYVQFLDSCDGLLLFEQEQRSGYDVLSYIVFNPATKHWATVPICASCPPPQAPWQTETYLIFDPARAVSPHFHLIQFCKMGMRRDEELSVHTYSSESGKWSHSHGHGQLVGWHHQATLDYGFYRRTFVNGILHFMVTYLDVDIHHIVALDVQRETKWIITTPAAAEGRRWHCNPFIGQSQGRLHYINEDCDAHDSSQLGSELSIWELQDYDWPISV